METGLITGTKRRGAQNRDLTEVKLGQMREMNNQAVKGGVGPPKLEVSIIDESMMSSVYASPTQLLAYSPTHLSKKLVILWREPEVIQGNGLIHTVNVRLMEGKHEVICTKLDVVLTHEACIHIKKGSGDSITYELVFDVDGITNNCTDEGKGCRVDKTIVEKPCELVVY
jgi:hypothetical protein